MSADRVRAASLLKARLADRLNEPRLDWLDETRSLAAEGIASLDLIAALACLQRDTGLYLPDSFVIDASTSFVSLVGALAASRRPDPN
jgi:hypothetical protein